MSGLDRHLVKHHGISNHSHVNGAARGASPQQTQIGGFMTSSHNGGMPFAYNRNKMIKEFATYLTLDELPFSHSESDNLEHIIKFL